jgi:DNA-binding MarR family transcriptional regulator
LQYHNYYKIASIREERYIISHDYNPEALARNLIAFRRILWREMIRSTVKDSSEFDISLLQFLTLFLLITESEMTVKRVAALLGRSESATSRMLDQLVARGLVCRREGERDRRVKRVSLSENGRSFVAALEQKRAATQIMVMKYLSPEERAVVAQAMQLLADAARRHAGEHTESETTGTEHTDE